MTLRRRPRERSSCLPASVARRTGSAPGIDAAQSATIHHIDVYRVEIGAKKTALWESTNRVARVRSTGRRTTVFRKWEFGG